MSFEPILLAPEEEIAELFPYRRVWRTGWQEVILLFAVVVLLWIAGTLLGLAPLDRRDPLPKLGIALLPVAAWLLISYRGERRAPQMRPRLLSALVLGALVANGIAVPLEERVFEPDLWLPGAGFFGRLIGYTLTLGITTTFLLYFALRFTVWPVYIRRRQDGVAYALAAALGFASVYSVRFALFDEATLLATALRVAGITYAHLAMGAIIGFFMAELVLARVLIFWLPIGLGFGAFIGGLYYAFRAIAILGGLSTAGTGSNPIRGLLLGFGLIAVVYLILAFIIQSADIRQAHAAGRRETIR